MAGCGCGGLDIALLESWHAKRNARKETQSSHDSLWGNNIGADGARALAETLRSNTALATLKSVKWVRHD